jgi:6,7-dimethyl-8-ribityllumazine synthase
MARLLIVEARFYEHLNDLLLEGARAAIEAAGHEHETVTVPGALEVPAAIALAAETGASTPSSPWAW